ncbi:two pore domain potassium channel family protein [Candidatus Peregrinibacteria bacterium]|nr:two pore domain potassium channel family protein [Candidatus Peregrinibacteria bacterium]
MEIHEAIAAIDYEELPVHLHEAHEVFEEKLAELPEDAYETRGAYFYYLLRISLKSTALFETELEKHYFEELIECFRVQEEKYLEKLHENRSDKLVISQMSVFYHLMERYFTILSAIYRKKDYKFAEQKAYLEKMRYRQSSFRFKRKWGKFSTYKFWEFTSLYGLSFLRWGISCLISVTFYALLYIFIGNLHIPFSSDAIHWYDAFHFSIATFTTLGLGDVVASDVISRFIVDIEVFNGYLMLGVFMALVQKRIF